MAERRHSTVFDVLTAITESVQTAEFPAHDATGRGPWLDDRVLPPESADEWVTVVQGGDEESSIVWSRVSPGGRDEVFTVEVQIGSTVPGRTRVQVLERLAELADVVQGLFYDPTTFVFTPPVVDGAVQLGGFAGVSTTVEAGSQGHVGSASLRYQFQARI
jgi:hypothetical protein